MAVSTSNYFGRISISDEAIAVVAGNAALECYGIVDMVSVKLTDNIAQLFKRQPLTKGVKLTTVGDRIIVDLYVVVKYSVSLAAVAESLKSVVKYKIENFTGMLVEKVNVSIVGSQI